MRFVADGPAIPDELLTARDDGRVVFFCGAGVSRARANLPDFFGLAKKVTAKLAVAPDKPANKLIQLAQKIDAEIGVPGVVSADRVFGLLEKDFQTRDIEEAVARALKPARHCDLTAHRLLLDLARTSDGRIQLVTTNFDRLFNDCAPKARSWQYPRLPDPLRERDLDGVVYLHGRASKDYRGAEGDGFILSTSEFGRAYLSDGWATTFVRKIIETYVVVFIGYSADDPPVQYLLEALRRAAGKSHGIYAFQSGDADDAATRWEHKGVEAMPYDPAGAHQALWRTLEAWAGRARGPEKWRSGIVEIAKRGPSVLSRHERGQVAHVVSTLEGAKTFASATPPPPSDWLCVFDAARRHAKPSYVGDYESRNFVDPFEHFGIDGDPTPKAIGAKEYYSKRDVPTGAWSAFATTRRDRLDLKDENLPALTGFRAGNVPRLPPRLHYLARWIAEIATDPGTAWWAAWQKSLHPDLQAQILWALSQSGQTLAAPVRDAWQLLFEAWSQPAARDRSDLFELRRAIARHGWSSQIVRAYASARRPRFQISPNHAPLPPSPNSSPSLLSIIHPDVAYPDNHPSISAPNEWLAAVATELRRNLELAVTLESEIGGHGLRTVDAIVAEKSHHSDTIERAHGLSNAVIEFSRLVLALSQHDLQAAKNEIKNWPPDEPYVFCRLLIWACGVRRLVAADIAGEFFSEMNPTAFWFSRNQRDLLLALKARWNSLSIKHRRSIELKILRGPPRWQREKKSEHIKRAAIAALARCLWLKEQQCRLSRSSQRAIATLSRLVPDWDKEKASGAAASLDAEGGLVKTLTDYRALLPVPLSALLDTARQLTGRHDHFLEKHDPFAGLSAERPVRAWCALVHEARSGNFPDWAWETFFRLEARAKDRPRLRRQIASSLVHYAPFLPPSAFASVSWWLTRIGKALSLDKPALFNDLVAAFVDVVRANDVAACSAIVRTDEAIDWNTEAINSPAGDIAETMFDSPYIQSAKPVSRPSEDWFATASRLMASKGDVRRYVLVVFFYRINWFYWIAPDWTEKNLLGVLGSDELADRDACWAGILQSGRLPQAKLFLRLKKHLLELSI